MMTSGVYRYGLEWAATGFRLERPRAASAACSSTARGREAVVAVSERPGTARRFLSINGKTDAGGGPEDVLAAEVHRPRADAPASRAPPRAGRGLGIGRLRGRDRPLPGGAIECVEIEPATWEAAPLFDALSGAVRSDPRFRIVFRDGRNHLLGSPAAVGRDRLRALERLDRRGREPVHARLLRGRAREARAGRPVRRVVPLLQHGARRRDGGAGDVRRGLPPRVGLDRAAAAAGAGRHARRGPAPRGQLGAARPRLAAPRARVPRHAGRRRPARHRRRGRRARRWSRPDAFGRDDLLRLTAEAGDDPAQHRRSSLDRVPRGPPRGPSAAGRAAPRAGPPPEAG